MLSKTKPKLFFILLCLLFAFSVAQFLPSAHAQTYQVFIDAWDSTHSTNVVVPVNLDGVYHADTPTDTGPIEGSHYINANLTDTYGDNFQYWDYLGVHYIDNTFYLDESMNYQTVTAVYTYSSSPPPPPPPPPSNGTSGTGNYTFYGLNDEDSGVHLNATVYVTAYYNIPNTFPQRFIVNGSYGYNTTVRPQYFSYDLGYNDTREYWLSNNEDNVTLYILNSTNLVNIDFIFRDSTNALSSYDMCSAKRYVNGSLVIVDKRKIDITKQVVLYLKGYTLYTIMVSDGLSYTFGDVNTLSTSIDLTISGTAFPPDVLLANQYIRLWGYRGTGVITIKYEDTQNTTDSVTFYIKHVNGTVVYSATHTSENSFEDTWTSAYDNVTYYMEATIQTSYGTMTLSKTFAGTLGGLSPWSLAFLGTFPNGIDSSQLIPAIIILFVFGIFSVLNGYLGAFFGSVVYAFMAYMGWMNVNAGIIVAGLAFAFILGITFAKRRLLT